MTRFIYGGGGDGDIIKPTGVPYINATANVYNARTGGAQVTDLQNMSGAGITSVTTDAFGQAIFYGPDNFIGVLWLDFGTGVRWALGPKAVDLAALQAIAVQRAADAASPAYTAKAHLPYNVADPLEQALATSLDSQVVPRFASGAARDAAFPAPQEGDRCYRTDIRAEQVYNAALSSWRSASFAYNFGTDAPIPVNVSGTANETQLAVATVPANMPLGSTFRLTSYGISSQAANTTPDITYRIRVGGLTGTILASNTFTAASNATPTPRPWQLQANITITSTGTGGTWFGNMIGHSMLTSTTTLTSTGASIRCDGSVAVSRDTTTAQSLILTAQWSASSASNAVTMYGWYWERTT